VTEIIPYQPRVVALPSATSSETDEQLLVSWLASLNSPHSRRNFEQSVRRFLAALPSDLRHATIEDVRSALDTITAGAKEGTRRQYVLRAKSLLTYANKLGYTRFNAGTTIKIRSDGNRGAQVAKRIMSGVEVGLLIRAAASLRDKVLLQVLYAGGLRVSEVVALTWADVIEREGGLMQLSVLGKGGVTRQVLLPGAVSRGLLDLRRVHSKSDGFAPSPSDFESSDPVFVSREGGPISTRNVHEMVARASRRAGISGGVSPHWLRHSHASHALDNGATLAEVQATLGHANVSTTSGYLHARPNSSSGLKLDEGVFGK
jgi:site-specific recombinase XerD